MTKSVPSQSFCSQRVSLWPFFGIFSLLIFLCASLNAQSTDSLKNKTSLKPETFVLNNHSSKAAAAMSALVPGLGQVYNKKSWKVPLIYAGFASLGYAFKINQDKYTSYRNIYLNRMGHDSSDVSPFTNENLKTLIDSYHRHRDLFAIAFSALYILNIIDASVDAHLFTFDVSDDLSLKVMPYMNTIGYNPHPPVGLTLTCHFLR